MMLKFAMAAALAVAAMAATGAPADAQGTGYYAHAPKHCGALIRSAGRKNLVRSFARNSAVFAWKREAKYVYGTDHGNWSDARAKRIECHSEGVFVRCVAKANPCERY